MQNQMAAVTVASVVIQKLTDMLTEESISDEKMIKGHLDEIKKDLQEMRCYLLNAQGKHPNDDGVKKWAEDYLTLLYHVEDAIESFTPRTARQRMRLGFLMNDLFLKNCAACWMHSRKVKKIRFKIENLNSTRPKGVEDATVENHEEEEHVEANQVHRNVARSHGDATIYRDRNKQAKLMYSYSYYEEELDIVGFKREVHTMVRRLTSESIDAGGFVSIVGETGSGKTTLARAVYGNRQVKDSFKCRACVTLSKDYDAINLYRNLLKQVGEPEDQDVRIDEQPLKSTLLKRLREGKRYLIVLDDARSACITEYLRAALPANRNGSIVLITCREQEAEVYANGSQFRLEDLGEKDSMDLFLRKAGLDLLWGGRVDPQDKPQKILKACNYLPLHIVLLGSFLSAQNAQDFEKWIEKLSNKETWETNEILKLCYDDLTDFLKLCLLYMLLFPPELDIPVRRLLRLWQAEGFAKRPEKPDVFPEDVAQEYFDNLVKRSLIQVSKLRSDGRPRRCRLLGVLHDYLSPKALGVRLFHVHPKNSNAREEGETSFHVRRLVEYRDISNCSFYQSQHRELLRSFLSFNDQRKDTPAKEVGNLLDHIIRNGKPLLRVLDLEGLYKPSLPENLGDFFNLRYLGLRWTFLDTIPQSVGYLYYLETLDVKHTNINTLPSSIWKLKHLRHLNLNQIRLVPKNMPSSLPDLLTLWGLSVDEEFLAKVGLYSLGCLRELGITFHSSNSEQLLDWISNLRALRQLRLRCADYMGNPSNLMFKPLSELKELSSLYLLGKLRKLPERQDFPQEIKVLTLSVSSLADDPMPILGQLQSLTVLRLLSNSYLGEKISCRKGGFRQLRVLKLWMLEKLEEWDLEEEAMERLKELNLRCCYKLKYIPSRLLQQESFKELTLTDMPEEVSKQVEQEKSHHIYITEKCYFK